VFLLGWIWLQLILIRQECLRMHNVAIVFEQKIKPSHFFSGGKNEGFIRSLVKIKQVENSKKINP
jgi:hypothetical protein